MDLERRTAADLISPENSSLPHGYLAIVNTFPTTITRRLNCSPYPNIYYKAVCHENLRLGFPEKLTLRVGGIPPRKKLTCSPKDVPS